MGSVLPILEASNAQHQMHLSLETLEAPPSAIADIVLKAADEVDAQLLVLGANRKPVHAGFATPSTSLVCWMPAHPVVHTLLAWLLLPMAHI